MGSTSSMIASRDPSALLSSTVTIDNPGPRAAASHGLGRSRPESAPEVPPADGAGCCTPSIGAYPKSHGSGRHAGLSFVGSAEPVAGDTLFGTVPRAATRAGSGSMSSRASAGAPGSRALSPPPRRAASPPWHSGAGFVPTRPRRTRGTGADAGMEAGRAFLRDDRDRRIHRNCTAVGPGRTRDRAAARPGRRECGGVARRPAEGVFGPPLAKGTLGVRGPDRRRRSADAVGGYLRTGWRPTIAGADAFAYPS
jgi:hypothetical protein